jgi:acetate---CoA ligase (ADP-forming) subunit beta
MLKKEIMEILSSSKTTGWVLEPEAKRLLSLAGMDTPRFIWAKKVDQAIRFAEEIGFPVVGKVVSPKVIHKLDKGGVEVGIVDERKLKETFQRFSQIEGFAGMLVEEMLSGVELIVGAKVDYQFGPVILFGSGGIWTEIYRDVILRMAPLSERDTDAMIGCLKARPLLEGYRGASSVNLKELKKLLIAFSDLVMGLENLIESIDLNPVICSPTRCVVADARIMLKKRVRG